MRGRDIGTLISSGARLQMFQTYPELNKKQIIILVCKLNQSYRSLSGKSWADLHDVDFSSFRSCFEFSEILDKEETRLSQITQWNYMDYMIPVTQTSKL